MKNILFILLIFLSDFSSFSQTDQNANPVFNSLSTGEKEVEGLLLISNYYTLHNNIENSLSSVFISDTPSLAEVEKAALGLNSDFFILTKGSRVVAMILLQNAPEKEWIVTLMASGEQEAFPFSTEGSITENRAKELLKLGYDSTASISDGVLDFNNRKYRIISTKEIEAAVIDLIKEEKLYKKRPSEMIIPSQKEIAAYVLAETGKGGKLDFFTQVEGKENDAVQIKPKVFATLGSIALYKWGRACFDIGVNSVEDALAIFAKHKGRELNQRERDYIETGFYKEWER